MVEVRLPDPQDKTRALPGEVRKFRATWRLYAVLIAFASSAGLVALLERGARGQDPQGITWLRLAAIPASVIVVLPLISLWILLARKFPAIDSPVGFAIAVPGCLVTLFFGGLAAAALTVMILWVFMVVPMFLFLVAYPGIALGLLLPRIVVPSLRPDRLRMALESDAPAPPPTAAAG